MAEAAPLAPAQLVELAAEVIQLASRARIRLGLAESCTGGLVAAALTAVPGSSAVVIGGVVAYSNAVKQSLLAVPEAVLLAHGAVSAETARAMALGAQQALAVDLALSVTGIAGPGGAVPGKPVGTVWFGRVLGADRPLTELRQFPGDRTQIRAAAARFALLWLAQALA